MSTSYASRSDFQLSSRCSCSKIDDSSASECLGLRRRARSSSTQKRPLFRAESLTFPPEERASKSWAKCQFLNGLCFYTAGSRRIAVWFGWRETVSACCSDRLQSSVAQHSYESKRSLVTSATGSSAESGTPCALSPCRRSAKLGSREEAFDASAIMRSGVV